MNSNPSMRNRRAVILNDKSYTSLDLTPEEKQAGNIIRLDVKECTVPGKSTLSVEDNPEHVFGAIIDVLEKDVMKIEMSDTHWKLKYTKS